MIIIDNCHFLRTYYLMHLKPWAICVGWNLKLSVVALVLVGFSPYWYIALKNVKCTAADTVLIITTTTLPLVLLYAFPLILIILLLLIGLLMLTLLVVLILGLRLQLILILILTL